MDLPVLDIEVVVLEHLFPLLRGAAQAGTLKVVLRVDLLVRVPFHAVFFFADKQINARLEGDGRKLCPEYSASTSSQQ